MQVDFSTLELDSLFVDSYFWDCALCTYCCPCFIRGHFALGAPMVSGQRHFIGSVLARSICDPLPAPPCDPPHHVDVLFDLDGTECEDNQLVMTFMCSETPIRVESWGVIKAICR
ncbi:MAG: hypothetical protein KAY32_17670 [Candidatus Eisenbacteria sp.]|nr:hypothetical protein [Candidatus Eisenbacteria bacterium]